MIKTAEQKVPGGAEGGPVNRCKTGKGQPAPPLKEGFVKSTSAGRRKTLKKDGGDDAIGSGCLKYSFCAAAIVLGSVREPKKKRLNATPGLKLQGPPEEWVNCCTATNAAQLDKLAWHGWRKTEKRRTSRTSLA